MLVAIVSQTSLVLVFMGHCTVQEKSHVQEEDKRATTNVQNRFVQIFLLSFFSFVLIELKPFVLKGKVLGENF